MQNLKEFQHFKTQECKENLCPCYLNMTTSKKIPPNFAECFYFHNEQDRRRPPFRDLENLIPAYECSKPFGFTPNPQKCINMIEEMYHPSRFKLNPCLNCEGYYCPNYHGIPENEKWNAILKRVQNPGFIDRRNLEQIKQESNDSLFDEEEEKQINEGNKRGFLDPIQKKQTEWMESDEEGLNILNDLNAHSNKGTSPRDLHDMDKIKPIEANISNNEESIPVLYKRIKKIFSRKKPLSAENEPVSPKSEKPVTEAPQRKEYRGAFDYQERFLDCESNKPEFIHSRPKVVLKNQDKVPNMILQEIEAENLSEIKINEMTKDSLLTQINRDERKENKVDHITSAFEHLSRQFQEKRLEVPKIYDVETIESQMKSHNASEPPIELNGHAEPENNQSILYGTRTYYAGEKTDITENMQNEFKYFKSLSISYLEDLIEKYVCSFLNSKGGTLYLGITDDGTVHGIKLTRRNLDEISVAFDRKLKNFTPPIRADQYCIKANFVKDRRSNSSIRDLYIMEIEIKQGDPSDLYFTDMKECFIRKQASSILLQPAAIK